MQINPKYLIMLTYPLKLRMHKKHALRVCLQTNENEKLSVPYQTFIFTSNQSIYIPVATNNLHLSSNTKKCSREVAEPKKPT